MFIPHSHPESAWELGIAMEVIPMFIHSTVPNRALLTNW